MKSNIIWGRFTEQYMYNSERHALLRMKKGDIT
jgi:hypothetical protein